MKHLPLNDALRTFELLFGAAQHKMFKAEVLQDYTAVDNSPSLQAWLAGDKQASRKLGLQDKNIVAYRNKCLQSPARITRVHVVSTPHTPYLEWEIAVCYKDSLLAHNAELILQVQLRDLGNATVLPAGDFWIFDDTHVLQWEYEPETGVLVGAQLWSTNGGDTIDEFQKMRALLLRHATAIS